MRTRIAPVLALAVCGVLLACGGGPSASSLPATETESPALPGHGYRVAEVIQAGNYTYVQVRRDDETLWAAAPRVDVAVGDDVALPANMMPMKDWHSETLNRTWDVVYFVGAISKVGSEPSVPGHARPAGDDAPGAFDFSAITVPDGGTRIAELYRDKEALAGRPVVVRGIVVKVSAQIMGKNWVHIRDGSGEPGRNDLTVTTAALPAVADTVVARGVLATDIDFGAGYVFDVIVEDAEVDVE